MNMLTQFSKQRRALRLITLVATGTLLSSVLYAATCNWADQSGCNTDDCARGTYGAYMWTNTYCAGGTPRTTCCICTEVVYACNGGDDVYGYVRTKGSPSVLPCTTNYTPPATTSNCN